MHLKRLLDTLSFGNEWYIHEFISYLRRAIPTNISLSVINNNEMCYTYSTQCSNKQRCLNNEFILIIFGIFTHERLKFTSRKSSKSLESIHPNNYNAKSLKLHRSSMLGIKIQNDINSEAIATKNMQYILNNDDVISYKNHENHDGLPTETLATKNHPSKTLTKAPTDTPTNALTKYITKTPTNMPTNTLTISPTQTPTNAMTTQSIPVSEPVATTAEFSLIRLIELTIKKYVLLNEMIYVIEVSCPSDNWFGFSFSITIEFNVFGYMLPSSAIEFTVSLNEYNDIQTNELNGKSIITIKSAYNIGNIYNFTSYFECNSNSIPIISAIGNGLNIGYHNQREVKTITYKYWISESLLLLEIYK